MTNQPGDWVFGFDWRPCGADASEMTTVGGYAETLSGPLNESGASPVSEYQTKDSGKRAEYATGCVRDTTEGKGSFVSISPHMLNRVARLLERGASKYALFNYQKGMPFSRCFDSLMRHTNQAFMGDKAEDHLSAIIFNAACLIHFEEEIAAGRLPAELNDIPRYAK